MIRHSALDLLTAKLWTSFLLAKLRYADQPRTGTDTINAKDVKAMLDLRETATFILAEIKNELGYESQNDRSQR